MSKFLKALALLVVGIAIWMYMKCSQCSEPPKLDPEEWWGPEQLNGKHDTSIRPFQVKFSEQMITDLRHRLKNHRPFAPPLEGVAFTYGFNSGQLDSWLQYWADQYPFSQREKFLNQFPQYKTNVQGLDVHFIRVKPQVPSGVRVVPLLMLHGWPGSIREFYDVIPILTSQATGYDFVFEVIVPSLPGYGFSDAAVRPGLAAPQAAVVFKNLMSRLGHNKFYVQGGDWGASITSAMSTLFPEDILGHHNNLPISRKPCSLIRILIGSFIPSLIVEDHLADRIYPLSSFFANWIEESGYFHLQATRPDTVGVALTDSPAGLLAYVLEKFSCATRNYFKLKDDGGLETYFTKEQLIDNLMIYWASNSITTSLRFYAENLSKKTRALNVEGYSTTVPTWVLQAKYEIIYQPAHILKFKYPNLLNATVLPDGGHFIAFEQPKVFAEDVFKAVKAFIEWHESKNSEKTDL